MHDTSLTLAWEALPGDFVNPLILTQILRGCPQLNKNAILATNEEPRPARRST